MSPLAQLRNQIQHLVPSAFESRANESATELRAVESKLNTVLPLVLKEFYEAFDSAGRLFEAHNHMLRLEHLRIEAGAVLIVEEQERYYRWGIKMEHAGLANPPVFQSTADSATWVLYDNSLECFLGTTVCWQALNLMPEMATSEYTDKFLQRLSGFLSPMRSFGIRCSGQEDSVALLGTDVVAVAYPKQSIVYLATSDTAALERLADQFEVEVDYL